MSWSTVRGRASQRGARGNRGRWAARPKIAYDVSLAAPLGNIVKKVLLKDLEEELSESKLRARGEECVASFNLMEGQNVAITIPGSLFHPRIPFKSRTEASQVCHLSGRPKLSLDVLTKTVARTTEM
jgi:hypothetical protein